MGAYLELIRQQKQTQQQETELRTNMMSAAETDPDSLARAKKSADMLGLPLQAVQERLPEVEKQAFVEGFGYQDLIKQAPRTAEWLAADPLHAGVAKDDIENLSYMERLFSDIGQKFEQGRMTTELSDIGFAAITGKISDKQRARQSEIEKAMQSQKDYGITGFFEGIPSAVANQLPILGQTLLGKVKGAVAGGAGGAAVGAGTALVAGQLGPQVAAPEEVVTVPAAAVATGARGAVLGWKYGSAVEAGKLEASLAYLDFEKIKDETGQPLDRNIALTAALLVGGVNGALEGLTGVERMVDSLPGIKNFTREGMKQALKSPTVRAALLNYSKRIVTTAGTEGATEFLQNMVKVTGGEIGRAVQEGSTGGLLDRIFSDQNLTQSLAEARAGAQAGGGMATVLAAPEAVADTRAARNAQQTQQVFQAIGDGAKAVKLNGRLPDKFRDLMERYAGAQNAFIDAAQFNQYFQAQGIDPAGVARELGVPNYREAVAAGTDIVIPMGEFASKLAPTDHLQGLMPDMKLSQGELSAREYEAQQADQESQQAEIAEQAEPVAADTAFETIKNDLFGQLVGRFDRSTAEAYAQAEATRWVNYAQRAKIDDPVAWYRGYNVTITSPLPDVLTKRPDLDTVIDPMIDAIRAGTLPTDTEVNGPSLTEFLRERGGVQDEGGELASRDAKQQVRGLVRDTGMSLDAAREAAAEAGYIDMDSTVSDFIDLLDNELRGDMVYSGRNRNDSLAEQQNALRELSTWLDQQGIDLNSTDNAAIKRLMYPESEGREFEQRNDVTQTPEFKAWFGDSKVVDAEGRPLVVYHGTTRGLFSEFKLHERSRSNGFVFTSSKNVALTYSGQNNSAEPGQKNPTKHGYYSVHLSLQNPKVLDWEGASYGDNGGTDAAIQKARDEGFDGVILKNVDDAGMYHSMMSNRSEIPEETGVSDLYIAFRPEQIKSVNNRGTFDASNPNILEQRQQDGARGYIRIGDNQRMSIALLERANLSTFLHETGHMWLEVLGDLATSENAPEQIKQDYKTILDWFGVESREQIQVEHHEKFARGNEAYLMEGKAPSAALRAVFQRFKAWLTMIYRNISRLDVQLTPEVRAVFDRIYASDEEIEAARAESGMQALFSSAEQMGLTDAEFAAYRSTVTDASVQAQDKLRVELMNEYQREQTKWWNEEREKVRQQVTAEVNAQPVYVAFDALVSGTQGKLSKDDLIRRYGEAYLKRFKRGYGEGKGAVYATDGGGMDIDLAAEIFGYQSGDALVQDLVNIRPRKQLIDAETDARMREQYGDMMLDGTIAERAEHALHNDKRADILMTELRALRRKEREVAPFVQAERSKQRDRQRTMRAAADGVPPVEYFRNAARGLVSQQAVNELQPHRYLLAERKASRRAFEAMAKGEPTVAANEKQRELLNHFLYLESTAAQERADKIAAYAEGLTKRTTQERIGKAGEEYLDALNEILDAYQFRRTTNKQLQLIAKVRAAVAAADAEGEIIDVMMDEQGNVIDPALLNVRNYRELTIDELEAVRDMLKNIEHVAREKNKFRTAEVQAEFDEISGKVLDEIAEGKPAKPVDVYKLRDPRHQKWRAIPLAIAEWRGLFSYLQEAVGFKQNSTLWNYVMRPLNDAAAREAVMKREAAKQLDALFERYSTTYLYGKGKVIPGVGSVNKQQQLMLAASWGTETGRQRMLDNGFDGRGLSEEQVNSVLDSLDERDWGFVQDLWKLFDSYWKPVADKQQRVTGVRPEQVDALPFMTQFGEMPGGYSPIAYESFLDNRAAAQQAAQIADEMKRAAYTRNTTRRGFLKQRVERIQGKAVRYDFGVIYKHLNEVIHDVTHHETLRDVQKLLNHKLDGRSILDEITQRMGYGVRDQIVETLEEIAVGDLRVMGNSERIMEHLAAGASIAGMAYNVWNAVQNITGISNSIAVIGPSAVMRGAWEWIGTPQHMLGSIDTVQEKSEFMRTRYLNMNRDINAMRGRLEQASGRPAVDSAYAAYREGGFWMMIRMQQLVDMPTWIGAYDQAKRDFPDITEANAVALADQAVLAAQGGGRTVDLSKFMRGKGWARVWTVFAGYFNVVYQRTAESMLRAGVEGYTPQAVGRMVTDMFFLMIAPAAMTVILKQAIDALVGGDDDDAEEWMTKYFKEQVSYILAMFPFIRETSAAVAGYASYSGPVGARFFADVNKFIRQVAQGEVDENLVKAGVRVAGTPFGIPTSQIIKTYDGMEEMMAGDATPLALLFGPPKKD